MRLGPLEIVRAARVPEAASELGASGTQNLDGWLQGHEYNPDLQGVLALQTFDRMRRSDATVREALWHINAPILNADWAWEPASEEPLDLEVAEFARRATFEWCVDPFDQTLRSALLHLAQGFQVFELVEQVVEAELRYSHPKTHELVTIPRRSFLTWRRFAERRADTIYRWLANGGELKAVQQRVWVESGYEEPVIPADRLMVLINEREGDDWTGVSILRPAYKAWWMKGTVEKIAGIAFERHGVGINTAYIPAEYRSNAEMLNRIEKMLRDLRAGEFSYLVFPGPKGQAGASGAEGGFYFEVVTPEGGFPDFLPFLQYLRGEIKGAVLARFAELGHGQTGARATGDVQSQVWYDALQSTADYIGAVFSEAGRRLIDRNYSVDRYPRLVARDIEVRTLSEFAAGIAQVAASGAVSLDRPFREFVRKGLGAPPEEEVPEPEEVPEVAPSTKPELVEEEE